MFNRQTNVHSISPKTTSCNDSHTTLLKLGYVNSNITMLRMHTALPHERVVYLIEELNALLSDWPAPFCKAWDELKGWRAHREGTSSLKQGWTRIIWTSRYIIIPKQKQPALLPVVYAAAVHTYLLGVVLPRSTGSQLVSPEVSSHEPRGITTHWGHNRWLESYFTRTNSRG